MYKYTNAEKQGILKVTINAKDWESAIEQAYEKNKGKYKVQGFRQGKVPRKVIEQNYGDTVFFDDAFNDVISKEFSKFLAENKDVRPASMPEVNMDSFTADKGVEATLTFDLMPEVTIGSLSTLKAKKAKVTVTEKDIEAEIEKMRNAHARFVEVETKAENGDIATIDFSGSVNGKKFDGGTSENYRLELGSHTFIEGFEDQVIGMKKGESKDVKVTFPEVYQEKSLQGKPAVFAVTVKKVERKELPEINDKFISNATEFETLDEYKKSLKEKLSLDADRKANFDYENSLIEEVVNGSKVDIPHSMIHDEAHYMIHNFEHRLEHQNMKLEDYLAYTGSNMDAFHDKMMVDAEKTVKTRLVLQKLVAENKIEVPEADLDGKLADYAAQYGMEVSEFKKNVSKDDMAYFENEILMDKIIGFLKSQNK